MYLRARTLLLPLYALAIGVSLQCAAASAVRADTDASHHVIVRMKTSSPFFRFYFQMISQIQSYAPVLGTYNLKVPDGMTQSAYIAQVAQDPDVAQVEPDLVVELASKPITSRHNLEFDGEPDISGYVDNNTASLVNFGTTLCWGTGSGVRVAVLDTGIALDHPGLAGAYEAGYNFISPGDTCDDIADGTGLNSGYGHGTMVSGIIHQLAPDAAIVPLRILDGDGYGTLSSALAAIEYAIESHVQIMNMSFSTSVNSRLLSDALRKARGAGILLVAAAGNDDTEQAHYPAAYDCVLSVGSVEEDDTKSSFSNYGDWVKLLAPGHGIPTLYPGNLYAAASGTSFSAPFVAAEAALLMSVAPNASPDAVEGAIFSTAWSADPYNDESFAGKLGYGVIDIESAALTMLPLMTPPAVPPTDTPPDLVPAPPPGNPPIIAPLPNPSGTPSG